MGSRQRMGVRGDAGKVRDCVSRQVREVKKKRGKGFEKEMTATRIELIRIYWVWRKTEVGSEKYATS